MRVQVLTDDKEVAFVIKAHVLGLGYECETYTRVSQFKEGCKKGKPYFLAVDYLLFPDDCHQLLNELLDSELRPAGLLVMSGLPKFEDSLSETAELYAQAGIPFLFLEKPFHPGELAELLFRLHKSSEKNRLSRVLQPICRFETVEKFGSILQAARENLGLQISQVASCARSKGAWITDEDLAAFEGDDSGKLISCEEWLFLVKLLYESPNSIIVGFDAWRHLRKVRYALTESRYHFPRTLILRQRLMELARRELIEKNFNKLESYNESGSRS